jgi:hypothetical protein
VIGNGAPEYRVVYFEAVRASLKILAKRARAAGRHAFFLGALKAFDRRLRSDPRSIGETLYTLKQAGLEVRLGGEAFLSFRFLKILCMAIWNRFDFWLANIQPAVAKLCLGFFPPFSQLAI